MSSRVDADGDALASYALTANAGPLTACGWIYLNSLRGVTGFPIYFTDNGGTLMFGLMMTAANVIQPINDAFSAGSSFSPSTGVWMHLAVTRDIDGVVSGYLNGVAFGSVAITNTGKVAFLFIGGNTSTSWVDADFAYWRVWQRTLNSTQIDNESRSPVALERTGLYADWPMLSGSRTTDLSGMGHGVSEEGAIGDGGAFVIAPATTARADRSIERRMKSGAI